MFTACSAGNFALYHSLKMREVKLSPREKEVLQLILQEYTNEEIATAMKISKRTVETHRKHIFRKTGAKSIVGIVKYGLFKRLVQDDGPHNN